MPYKFEYTKTKIAREDDNRIKLSLEDREEIKRLYGVISQRKLAKAFNVSRRLIVFIGDPEQHKKNLKRREERGGTMAYYDKDKHKISMKKHRKHKKILYDKNRLLEETK